MYILIERNQTGSHTYASWTNESKKRRGEVDDFEIDGYGVSGRDRYFDEEDPNMETSFIVKWLRSFYNTIFFYGLEQPDPSQRRNKAKIMRELERDDKSVRKNRSPFFTASEQRVQRYLAARSKNTVVDRELEEELDDDFPLSQQTTTRKTAPSSRKMKTSTKSGPVSSSGARKQSQSVSLRDLEIRLRDLSEELELVDAEVLTMPAGSERSREYLDLMERRERLLDQIDEVNIELVDRRADR